MKTFISLVRGINVGGRNAIKMSALREMYQQLGFSNVQSLIQSGNVVFSTEISDGQTLSSLISMEILNTFGFKVPVLVLEQKELIIILEDNPYLTDSSKNPDFIHLTFLSDFPDKSQIDSIKGIFGSDEFSFGNRVIYIYCPDGYGNTKLNNTFFENKLKLIATTRNLNTTMKILTMAND